MSAITFDLINCLRSSLDHAVYDGTAILAEKAAPENTKFPFGENAKNCADRAAKSGVPRDLLDFIVREYRPYLPANGGDEALGGLNKLRNQKIHRLLSTFAFQSGQVGVNDLAWGGEGRMTILSDWDRDKQEFTYAITEDPEIGHIRVDIVLDIGFDQPPAFDGKPFLGILTNLIYRVDEVVRGMETETNRLNTP
jgi:hypothetical protein